MREWEERIERERRERERVRQENAYQSWWDNFSREQAKR